MTPPLIEELCPKRRRSQSTNGRAVPAPAPAPAAASPPPAPVDGLENFAEMALDVKETLDVISGGPRERGVAGGQAARGKADLTGPPHPPPYEVAVPPVPLAPAAEMLRHKLSTFEFIRSKLKGPAEKEVQKGRKQSLAERPSGGEHNVDGSASSGEGNKTGATPSDGGRGYDNRRVAPPPSLQVRLPEERGAASAAGGGGGGASREPPAGPPAQFGWVPATPPEPASIPDEPAERARRPRSRSLMARLRAWRDRELYLDAMREKLIRLWELGLAGRPLVVLAVGRTYRHRLQRGAGGFARCYGGLQVRQDAHNGNLLVRSVDGVPLLVVRNEVHARLIKEMIKEFP